MLIFIIFHPICNNLGHRDSLVWQNLPSCLQLEITCADTGTQTHTFGTHLSFKTFLQQSVLEEGVHTCLTQQSDQYFLKGIGIRLGLMLTQRKLHYIKHTSV